MPTEILLQETLTRLRMPSLPAGYTLLFLEVAVAKVDIRTRISDGSTINKLLPSTLIVLLCSVSWQ